MALHQNVLVEHSFATFFLQAILDRSNTLQGVLSNVSVFCGVLLAENLCLTATISDLPSLSTELAHSLQQLKKFDNDQVITVLYIYPNKHCLKSQ
jgi:hypothetical protein